MHWTSTTSFGPFWLIPTYTVCFRCQKIFLLLVYSLFILHNQIVDALFVFWVNIILHTSVDNFLNIYAELRGELVTFSEKERKLCELTSTTKVDNIVCVEVSATRQYMFSKFPYPRRQCGTMCVLRTNLWWKKVRRSNGCVKRFLSAPICQSLCPGVCKWGKHSSLVLDIPWYPLPALSDHGINLFTIRIRTNRDFDTSQFRTSAESPLCKLGAQTLYLPVWLVYNHMTTAIKIVCQVLPSSN